MNAHGILSARYAGAPPDGGYSTSAAVVVTRAGGGIENRRLDDDIDGGGMVAFLAGGGTVSAYVAPPITQQDLIAYASQRRWEKEVGGIVVSGINVPTDDRAKGLIGDAARMLADGESTPFIANGVNYGTVTGAQMKAIFQAMFLHVRATYPALANVLAAINDGTITTRAQVDAAF